MSIFMKALCLSLIICISFFSGAFIVWSNLQGYYEKEIDRLNEGIRDMQELYPHALSNQTEIRFIVWNTIKTINLLEEKKYEDLQSLSCSVLYVMGSNIEPELASSESNKEQDIELKEMAMKKVREMEESGKCLTSQSSSPASQVGTH